jgi:CRISPR-associated RAMP protein (TIGR02581 family)
MSEQHNAFLGQRTFAGRLELAGTLTARTALRIGAGSSRDVSGPDLPVVQDTLGRPYIPGASFKGVLRACAESLLRGLQPYVSRTSQEPLFTCMSVSKSDDGETYVWPDGYRGYLTAGTVTYMKEREFRNQLDALNRALYNRSCWACRAFGAPWLASPLLVKDLPLDETSWAGHLGMRDGVGIDRGTGAAREKLRYDFQVAPAGTRFACQMVIDGAGEAEIGLILLALEAMANGLVPIGGAGSRGLGRIALEMDWERCAWIAPGDALTVFGDRATGAAALADNGLSVEARAGYLRAFLEATGLPVAVVEKWQQMQQEEGNYGTN